MNEFEKKYYEHEGFWNSDDVNVGNIERVRRTAALIPSDTASILDAACGNGIFCNYLTANYPALKVLGLDRSQTALSFVNCKKICADIADIPLADNSFDCVSALEVLEHLPIGAYEQAKREIARVAKKYLLIGVPNNQCLEDDMTQCPSCLTIFNPDLHLRSFTQQSTRELMEPHGFECINIIKFGIWGETFIGYQKFRRLLYPKAALKWRSPLCPLCGYQKNQTGSIEPKPPSKIQPGVVALLKRIVKVFWSKKEKAYWLIALYKRRNMHVVQ